MHPRRHAVLFALLLPSACSEDEPRRPQPDAGDSSDAAQHPDAGRDAGPDATVETRVDPELADAELLALWGDWSAIPRLDDRRLTESSTADRGDDAPLPLPLLDNGNKDLNNFVCRSRDARPLADEPIVPHHFDLDECPEDWVTGSVVARAEGYGGYASRIWLTTLGMRSGGGGDEILRVYRDDDRTPAVQATLRELADGLVTPFFVPPRSATQRAAVVLRHPIAFDHRLVVTLDRLEWLGAYYAQVDVERTGASRPRHDGAPLDAARSAALALAPRVTGTAVADDAEYIIAAGEVAPLAGGTGTGTVQRIAVTAPDVETLADLWLLATWDGVQTPAIDAPLASLVGAGLGAAPHDAPIAGLRAGDGGGVVAELLWPMPFRNGFELALRAQDLGGTVRATVVVDFAAPPADHGSLHVVRRVTTGPTDGPHRIADVSGAGAYAGTWLYLEGHPTDPEVSVDPLAFLEGDPVGWVDGVLAMNGTGTEDYLDSAFYFANGPFATLDAGAVQIEPGRVTAYRFHLLTDAVQFGTSFRLDLEVGPGDPAMLDRYETVAFFYLAAP